MNNERGEDIPMTHATELKTPDQILQAALVKEEEAHQFYGELLLHCQAHIVRELVEKLRNEEYKHVRMVKEMITKLNLGKGLA
jgi:rubrerythrin